MTNPQPVKPLSGSGSILGVRDYDERRREHFVMLAGLPPSRLKPQNRQPECLDPGWRWEVETNFHVVIEGSEDETSVQTVAGFVPPDLVRSRRPDPTDVLHVLRTGRTPHAGEVEQILGRDEVELSERERIVLLAAVHARFSPTKVFCTQPSPHLKLFQMLREALPVFGDEELIRLRVMLDELPATRIAEPEYLTREQIAVWRYIAAHGPCSVAEIGENVEQVGIKDGAVRSRIQRANEAIHAASDIELEIASTPRGYRIRRSFIASDEGATKVR